MGVFSGYRERRVSLTGEESLATLLHMENFFQDGANWTQGVYNAANGAKCLVGAANHVRVTSIDDAKYYLRRAIAERGKTGLFAIERFNDASPSFDEVAAVIDRAKQLAASAGRALPRPEPVNALVGEILPPVRPSPPAPAPVTALPVVHANTLPVAANPRGKALPRQRRQPTARRSLWDWSD